MNSPSLEERVRELERQFAAIRATLADIVRRQRPSPRPNSEKVSESYWKAREERLAKVQMREPLDSTQVVSEDRDRA